MTRRFVLVLAGFGSAWLWPAQAQEINVQQTYLQAAKLEAGGDLDGAMAKVTAILQQDPGNRKAHVLRGDLYAKKRQWSEAEQEFSAVLKTDPDDSIAKFDLSEIKMLQKQYQDARPGFLDLIDDKELGDLAAYKVFLCDLFGGSRDEAAKELSAFDRAQNRASYYYANAAWKLFQHEPDDARSWLDTAAHIYTPETNHTYSSTLTELGYLPQR